MRVFKINDESQKKKKWYQSKLMISLKIENANCNYFANFAIINECDKHLRVVQFKIETKTILFIFIDLIFKFSIYNIL